MDSESDENLKELFERFVGAEQAEEAVEDIRRGERIIEQCAAPEPSEEVTAGIKAEIARTLAGGGADAFRRTAYRAAAVAAVFVILAGIAVKLFDWGGGKGEIPVMSAEIWDSNDITADDENLAMLAAEVEQIEGELLALRLGENGGNGYMEVVELETELAEINADFWKG